MVINAAPSVSRPAGANVNSPASRRAGRAQAGFTLVELMLAIVVLVVMSALAAPSFRDFAIGQRIKATSFDLFADLTYARGEAIKSNSEVVVGKAAGGWKNGWTITWVDSGGATRTLRNQTGLDSSLAMAATLDTVRFARNGRLRLGTQAVRFTIDDAKGKTSISALCVTIDPSGMAKANAGACA